MNEKRTIDDPAAANAMLSAAERTKDPQHPNTQNSYVVKSDDLPLHCPMPGTTIWNSHPRVFLPIEETGHSKCSYCGAEFTLEK